MALESIQSRPQFGGPYESMGEFTLRSLVRLDVFFLLTL
jgi:hypothetical protein